MSEMARWVGKALAGAFGRLQARFLWRSFTLRDAAPVLGSTPGRAALTLSRLTRAGWLARTARASYVALDARWVWAAEGRDPFGRYVGHPFFPALATAVSGALQLYGGRLQSIALFGSCARLAYTTESDVDLLLVVVPLPDSSRERIAEIAPVARDGARIAVAAFRDRHEFHAPQFVLMTPTELVDEPPLLLDLTEDADILFDPERVLTGTLQRLRAKLRRHGAQHISLGGTPPFWRLHPGARLGEIAEL